MGAPVLPPIEQRLTFLMHRISAQLARICNPMFREMQIDIVEARILVILLEKGAVIAGDIVRIMALPQSTISHQVKRLERRGYVTRKTARADSRSVMVSLSPAGRDVAERCNALSRDVYRTMMSGITADEAEALRSQLEDIFGRLSLLDPDEPGRTRR